MALSGQIKSIIAKGIGFTPGGIEWIVTHGFGASDVTIVAGPYQIGYGATMVPGFTEGVAAVPGFSTGFTMIPGAQEGGANE